MMVIDCAAETLGQSRLTKNCVVTSAYSSGSEQQSIIDYQDSDEREDFVLDMRRIRKHEDLAFRHFAIRFFDAKPKGWCGGVREVFGEAVTRHGKGKLLLILLGLVRDGFLVVDSGGECFARE